MPVNGSPICNTMTPFVQCSSPRPANVVSRQPVRVLPSNNDCHPSPSGTTEGWAAAPRSTSSSVGRGGTLAAGLVDGEAAAWPGCPSGFGWQPELMTKTTERTNGRQLDVLLPVG